MMNQYDPEHAPNPDEWLELGEQERILLVEQYHRFSRAKLPNLTAHAVFHAIVENQIAAGLEPVLRAIPMNRPPIYLRVPPGHAKHWSKHCHEYNACGERVFFVQDSWYNREYVPRYQEQHRDRRDDGWDERREDHRGGQGKGRHGNGHGRDH